MASLFAISPGRGRLDELWRRVPELARGGVQDFLLREKRSSTPERRSLARTLAPLCREYGMRLWLSDDIDLARELGLGVHLSEMAGAPPADVDYGLSLHEASERGLAEREGAHHAFFGPVFSTPSKRGLLQPTGLPTFARWNREFPGKLYALGGVVSERLPAIALAGIHRIAAIRLFFDAPCAESAAREALSCLETKSCP